MSTTQPPQSTKLDSTARKVRIAIWTAIITALLVIVGIIVFANTNDPKAGDSPAPSQSQAAALAPAHVTDEGGVLVATGTPSEKAPHVIVYVDFICPACQQFEKTNGEKLQQMAAAGDIKLEYRPIAILDRASTSKYSSRALNAFACVIDSKPESAVPFLNKLMEEQPQEGTAGLTNDKLAEHASNVGAPGLQACAANAQFAQWTKTTTSKALGYGLDHTPYVVVNDVLWDNKSDIFDMITKSKSV